MKTDYHKIFESELEKVSLSCIRPKLLMHACCAPCAAYPLELLKDIFDVHIFFYNPNIYPESEHDRRYDELISFISKYDPSLSKKVFTEKYSPADFISCSAGNESSPEGRQRCFDCYSLRLSKTAVKAAELEMDYFTTALTISPHKNAESINKTGAELSQLHGVKFLHSDFKKKDGFKKAAEISRRFELYRQDYCGCSYSNERGKGI